VFRGRVFTVASLMGLVVGFSLFGAVTYLPQYQQIVKGASPTSSGLQLLPLMAGVLLTSIGSGQLISRSGRYRVFPILGTAVMTVGMLLLSRLGPETPEPQAWLSMFAGGREGRAARHRRSPLIPLRPQAEFLRPSAR